MFKVEKSFYKTLAVLTIPLALQNLISYGVVFMDNFMISTLGDAALSGVFVSNQVQWILGMISGGLAGALVVLAAQYMGKGDVHRAKIIVTIVLKIAMGIGVFMTLLVMFFPSEILGLFSDDPGVISEGLNYLPIVGFTYIFVCVNAVLLAAMRCVQNTKIGFISSLSGFLINVFLNWVLIFGNLGFAPLGVRGAAIATLTARIIEFSISFFYVRFKDQNLLFRLGDLKLWDKLLLWDFFRYGTPIILGSFFWGLGGVVQVIILGRLGPEVLTANTIANNLNQIMGVVVYAVTGAAGIIIGRTVGAGEVDKVKAYARALEVIFLSFGIITGGIIFLSKDLILAMAFQGISPQAQGYAIQFLTVFSVTMVGTAYQMAVLSGIVRAGGATHFVLVNDLFWVWIVVVPSALLAAFVFEFPPVVVFACLKCDQILKCGVAVIKLNRWDWMKKLTRE